ncbi:MAG: hypothetical protein ACKN9T_14970 [Candidatus Methylumidiphilus sp.]
MAKQPRTTSFYLLKCGLVAASMAGLGLLAGCGDDGSSGGGAAKTEAKLRGKVSNNSGPVSAGKLEVRDSGGNVVTTTQFSNASYSVTIPAGTAYPILLTAQPPADACITDPVKAVVTSSLADEIDLTGVTTDVVDGAIALGGITEQNIARASGVAINRRQKEGGVSAATGGSGGGPGNSGGGAGQGGHGGHNMDDMRKAQAEASKVDSAGPCVTR